MNLPKHTQGEFLTHPQLPVKLHPPLDQNQFFSPNTHSPPYVHVVMETVQDGLMSNSNLTGWCILNINHIQGKHCASNVECSLSLPASPRRSGRSPRSAVQGSGLGCRPATASQAAFGNPLLQVHFSPASRRRWYTCSTARDPISKGETFLKIDTWGCPLASTQRPTL